ncbi:adenosine deaminase [Litorilituus lipolyticus]|uniref:adenosine deaminase n=1 Tax=Litorilituus lipolyticus TaxID=2491017 RepID=A0A502KZJ8_9GAMM|nr:adenosine deaminase [Litorilituus lipolyticus]TPH16474.1 adenosine deaminase [Litorilituus lipolyticus]
MINHQLPLIDLHRHLDGNIRPETIWQLAQQNEISLPETNFSDFLPYTQVQGSEANLVEFLKKLDWGVNVLSSLDDVVRVAYENVEDAHLANIQYCELRFSPFYMAMAHNLPLDGVIEAVIEGVRIGQQKFKTKVNLIGILSRTFGVEKTLTELEALLRHKTHLVAIDLAGDEYNFPGHLFESHFTKVRDAGLQVTIHAGEAAGPESVWHAIEKLGASRIGHGVACMHDEKLMDFMKVHHIGIESCLTSNFQTGTVKDISNHPVKTFLDKGLYVCLNTDDPAVENIELPFEYHLASEIVGLSSEQITQLQLNALQMSFISDSEKQKLLNDHKANLLV